MTEADADIPHESQPDAPGELPPIVEYPDDTLAAALERHGIALPPEQIAQLARYHELVCEWNEKLNLTRHTSFEKFVSRDVVDSLKVAAHLDPGTSVIDVGTGGGVPGVILKIVRPDLSMQLTDTVGKKARAVDDIVKRIPLDAAVHNCRAQDILEMRKIGALVIRAVAPLDKLLTWFTPYQRGIEKMLVIKGPSWVDERYEARQKRLLNSWDLRKVEEWPLPGTHSQSVLLELKRKADPNG